MPVPAVPAAPETLLDAGDLRGWELSTRVTAELCALAQTGWLPEDPAGRTVRTEPR